jgi:hypothetical protein
MNSRDRTNYSLSATLDRKKTKRQTYHLELAVHAEGGAELRSLALDDDTLTLRTLQFGARDDDGGGTAVVTDGEVGPVGHQGVLLATEHDSDIGGVLLGGVKVSVVSNVGGEVGLDGADGEDSALEEILVVAEGGLGSREELLNVLAGGRPDGLAQRHEQVQSGLQKRKGAIFIESC